MDPFLGQIQAFGFSFAPIGWALCWGQTMSIAQNNALYALLGITFGGDGITTFGVPDLRGRTVVGVGQATTLTSAVAWGEKLGAESAALLSSNMPAHNHQIVNGNGLAGTVAVTTNIQTVNNGNESTESNNGANALGTSGNMPSIYRESPSGSDSLGGVTSAIAGTTSYSGSSLPFNIRNPYLGMYYCIATSGIFPSRG